MRKTVLLTSVNQTTYPFCLIGLTFFPAPTMAHIPAKPSFRCQSEICNGKVRTGQRVDASGVPESQALLVECPCCATLSVVEPGPRKNAPWLTRIVFTSYKKELFHSLEKKKIAFV